MLNVRPACVVFASLICALPASITSAQPADSAGGQAAFRVAVQAFRANQFDVAARAFEQAYELDPRPETAFSIAQANRRQYYYDRFAWRLQRAVQMYQAYLAKLPSGPRVNDAIDRIGEIEPILREIKQRGELVPFTAPVKTELVIGAEVDQAVVTVDGKPGQLWEPISVTAGAHEIRLEAVGYEPEQRRVVIAEGRFLPVDIALRAKPGKLSIRTEAGSMLYIDGQRIGELPRDEVNVVPGNHYVSITRRGRDSFNADITLGRDQRLVVDAPLQATTQRQAAKWVAVGAAAVAAASGGMRVWSYLAYRDAQVLDDKRLQGSGTPKELQSYNQLVRDADSRSQWSIGLGISAIAVGTVAAGLWWFDKPEPGGKRRVLSPVVGNDAIGVQMSSDF
jgi:hypothetical protein